MDSISVDRVSRRIGRVWALRDVSLDIARGEVLGVFGRSGSGKSTLLHLISGMAHPTSGSIALQTSDGEDSSWLNARLSIALQTPGLAPDLTVVENLHLFSALWCVPRKGRLGRIAMFIELLGLADARNRRVGSLSDGMKAAAEVARAFIAGAEITIIDGLIERLDRPIRQRTWEYVLARKRQTATLIIGTSSSKEAALCDRLAVLSRGKLAFLGKPDELKTATQNEVIVVESIRGPLIKSRLEEQFRTTVTEREGWIEFKSRDADADVAEILAEMKSDVGCVYIRRPSLDDALDKVEEAV